MQGEQPLGNVVFTVKEWFLDPDDDFTDTEVGALEGITVKIIGQSEKVTNVNGQAGFNLANGTYTYQVYEMDSQLTTVQGEITVSGTLAVDVKLYECLYTPTEVQELIDDESYVPVASSTELDDLRNTGSRTMGAGTIWAGIYTTGLNKTYVQVKNIDFIDYEGWVRLGLTPRFTGILDGNLLNISNLVNDSGLLGIIENAIIKNLIINDFNISGNSINNVNSVCSEALNSTFNNIYIYNTVINGLLRSALVLSGDLGGNSLNDIFAKNCTITGTDLSAGICANGAVRTTQTLNNIKIVDSLVEITTTTTGATVGGVINQTIAGDAVNNCTVENTTVKALSARAQCGGVIGLLRGITSVKLTSINNTITSRGNAGGVCGWLDGSTIRNSHTTGGEVSKTGTDNCGGLIGQIANNPTIENCFSTASVPGTGNVGGLIGSTNPRTVTNSYYDTQTSGRSDTGKGLPRTTAQMKAGTASSFILANGDIDPDSLAANAMYTSWDGATIWNFLTTNDYPILKP
jgi:hypothetical protein